MNSIRVFHLVLIICLLFPTSHPMADEIGITDSLIVSAPVQAGAETIVAIYSFNDEDLAGLDIPLKFGKPGDPIELLRVDFGSAVSGWDAVVATIDNVNKTVKHRGRSMSSIWGIPPTPNWLAGILTGARLQSTSTS